MWLARPPFFKEPVPIVHREGVRLWRAEDSIAKTSIRSTNPPFVPSRCCDRDRLLAKGYEAAAASIFKGDCFTLFVSLTGIAMTRLLLI